MSFTGYSGTSAGEYAQRRGNQLTATEDGSPGGSAGHTTRVIGGQEVLLDDEGFLVKPESWTERIAEELARESGLPGLTAVQWEIVHFLRSFYLTNGKAPLNRDIKRETGLNLLELERLFPGGIRHGARRFAGLPNPKSC